MHSSKEGFTFHRPTWVRDATRLAGGFGRHPAYEYERLEELVE